MSKSELHQKGMALRTELLGKDYVERMNKSVYDDPGMQKFRDVAAENVFGALWTRPGLDLKTRTLICVISDAATVSCPRKVVPFCVFIIGSAAWLGNGIRMRIA